MIVRQKLAKAGGMLKIEKDDELHAFEHTILLSHKNIRFPTHISFVLNNTKLPPNNKKIINLSLTLDTHTHTYFSSLFQEVDIN